MSEPSSTKPYLMRALYEWCVDNGYTPYVSVVVDANTRVPQEYVRNGEIVLNIGPLAANKLKMGNEYLEFSARFGGSARELMIPVAQVAAIYARENGQGMSFTIEPASASAADAPVGAAPVETEVHHSELAAREPSSQAGKPTLRVVK